jgi:hypothetical protein
VINLEISRLTYMRNIFYASFFSAVSAFSLFSCGMNNFDDRISESKMIEALQEALFLGSKTAAFNLGDSTTCGASMRAAGGCVTGYLGNALVEIIVPDTIKNVLDKISSFTDALNALDLGVTSALGAQANALSGLGKYGDSIKAALNRGAEQAAPKSVDVFKNAVFGMSFSDAKGMLMGDSIAATTYLHATTYSSLQSAFAPIIKEPLDLLNPNKFWSPIASAYNSFASSYSSSLDNPLVSALSPPSLPYNDLPEDISQYLSEYATGKALDGLFLMVGKQETALRADPWETVSSLGSFITDGVGDLLNNVFSKAKNGEL